MLIIFIYDSNKKGKSTLVCDLKQFQYIIAGRQDRAASFMAADGDRSGSRGWDSEPEAKQVGMWQNIPIHDKWPISATQAPLPMGSPDSQNIANSVGTGVQNRSLCRIPQTQSMLSSDSRIQEHDWKQALCSCNQTKIGCLVRIGSESNWVWSF